MQHFNKREELKPAGWRPLVCPLPSESSWSPEGFGECICTCTLWPLFAACTAQISTEMHKWTSEKGKILWTLLICDHLQPNLLCLVLSLWRIIYELHPRSKAVTSVSLIATNRWICRDTGTLWWAEGRQQQQKYITHKRDTHTKGL